MSSGEVKPLSSAKWFNPPGDWGLTVAQALAAYLDHCNLRISPAAAGWRFTSLKHYFREFIVGSSLCGWDNGNSPPDRSGTDRSGTGILFPGAIMRCRFDSGTMLLIYRSGHIRWITGLGFSYYVSLTQGISPEFTQGDLMVFPLPGTSLLSHRRELSRQLSSFREPIWAKAYLPPELALAGQWVDTQEIILGGSRSHRAFGRLRVVRPVEKDERTMQIMTAGEVCIRHDPGDDIHPTLSLPPGHGYLLTKLPGFSDPVGEMNVPDRVLI
jgi:hypothetical protein